MNTELSVSSKCFGLYINDDIIGFCAVLHQPHGVNPKIKRCHRLVILPDYQGIGLGYKFLNCVADIFVNKGFDFSLVTSAKNLIIKLSQSKEWRCCDIGVSNCSSQKSSIDYKRKSMRKAKTARFRKIKKGGVNG